MKKHPINKTITDIRVILSKESKPILFMKLGKSKGHNLIAFPEVANQIIQGATIMQNSINPYAQGRTDMAGEMIEAVEVSKRKFVSEPSSVWREGYNQALDTIQDLLIALQKVEGKG